MPHLHLLGKRLLCRPLRRGADHVATLTCFEVTQGVRP